MGLVFLCFIASLQEALTFLASLVTVPDMAFLRSLSIDIDRVAKAAVGKDWALYAALLDHWPEIAGVELARVTTPVKITFPARQTEARRTGGILVIRLPKGLALEFSFKIEQIRQRIQGYFGYQPIEKINMDFSYLKPEPKREPPAPLSPVSVSEIETSLEGVESDELRAALQSFGESVYQADQRKN